MITLNRPGSLQTLPPLSLYVHLPWCLKKCPYCDFNSHELSQAVASSAGGQHLSTEVEGRYLDALRADLESVLPQVWGRRVYTVFIGGGTPSLFSPAGIDRLLADIRARLPLEADAEITLEANPGTFEKDRFRAFREAGVNRLSIGVQSFDDAKLQTLGRVHSGDQARAAIAEAAACFDTFNIDLMYALPGQSLADLQHDLNTALSFRPPHLSLYHLTMEPNTRFATQPPANLPDDDTAFDMLDHLVAATAQAGLHRYEVSAYARAGHQSRHNLNYWMFGDYIGIGAGAHGKLSHPDGRIVRTWKTRLPKDYLNPAKSYQAGEKLLALDEMPFEFLMNALRLTKGVDAALFQRRTGLTVDSLASARQQAEQRGLLEADPARLVATARGQLFLNDLLQYFLL